MRISIYPIKSILGSLGTVNIVEISNIIKNVILQHYVAIFAVPFSEK